MLGSKETSSKVVLLADVVNIMAEVGRGADEESLASLAKALGDAEPGAGQGAAAVHPLSLAEQLTLLDAYFQRLTQGERFVTASKAFALVRDRAANPAIKAFATSRLARLELVGKPAPPFAGTDLDGRPIRSADLRGNVVLLVFWASWCPNSAEELARLEAAYTAYRDRGLRIVGINLDTLQESGKSSEVVRPAVREFLLEYNVPWPNMINGPGEQDYAGAFAVTEVPGNVLIGRDGNVINLDLTQANLDKAVGRAVGR